MDTKRSHKLFIKAVIDGDVERARRLLEDKVCIFNVNEKTTDGSTSLHIALRKGNKEMVNLLLENGADASARWSTTELQTCLHLAVRTDDVDLVDLMIKHSADVDQRDRQRKTPLHYAIYNQNYEIARKLLDSGADANAMDKVNYGPLHFALMKSNFDLAVLLLQHGADPNHRGPFGIEFHKQFVLQSPDRFDEFLRYGADVNLKDFHQTSALHWAAVYSPPQVLRKLLRMENVDVNEPDDEEKTPLHYSLMANYFKSGATDDDTAATMRLLIENGADIHAVDENYATPLLYSVKRNNLKAVQCLLSMGADPNRMWCSPLYKACQYGREEIIELLLARGATFLSKLDDSQEKLLQVTMSRAEKSDEACWRVVRLLMEKGLVVAETDGKHLETDRLEKLRSYQREVDRMKTTRVCEDYGMTYYDFLAMNGTALICCLRNDKIRGGLESGVYKEVFSNFRERLEKHFLRGMEGVEYAQFLYDTFAKILPYEVVDRIIEYLRG